MKSPRSPPGSEFSKKPVQQSLVDVQVHSPASEAPDAQKKGAGTERRIGELSELSSGYGGGHASARVNALRAVKKGVLRPGAGTGGAVPVFGAVERDGEHEIPSGSTTMFPALRPQRIDLP